MNKKAVITITDGHHYCESHKQGAPYIAVDLWGHNYGGGSPCDNEEEVQRSISYYKQWAIEEGDKPIVEDKRIKKIDLTRWIENV